MRILQVIEFFTPGMGGSTQVVYQLSRHLARRDHTVTVCTSNFGHKDAQFPDQPFQVHRFPCLSARWNFYITPDLIPWAWRHLGEYDIIHLNNMRTFQNAVIASIAHRKGIPYVISAHGSLPIIVQRQMAKRVYDVLFGRRILEDASKLVAVSPYEVKQYQQAGIPKEKVSMIPNGLDLDELADLPPRGSFRSRLPGLTDNTQIILFLGRLHQRKGIRYLVEAFARMKNTQLALVIAGPDDGEQLHLQALVEKLQTQERVYFVGPQYGRDKLAAYVDADVVISPGTQEIFGLVPFEAILCGTPVIVTDDSGSGQLIAAADAGYLIPYADIERLIEVLQQVLTSPIEARRRVKSGQQYIREHLDWNKSIVMIEKIYESCIIQAGSSIVGE